ncbi:MAG: ATP synthase F1 subunit delta [Candidatus Korobacteraceae bacterium]|jgi:F-type H+-transporting ATPase subunit delta
MTTAIVSRYARAFSDVVLELKLDPKQVTEQLQAVAGLYRASPELRRVWDSPAIAAEDKRGLLDAIAERDALQRPVRNFLAVLIDHGRIHDLELIARQFETELNHRLGIVEAEVTSARKLEEAEKHELLAEVSRVTGKQVSARYEIDPSLIGGATIRVGSTVYDGSVRGQLQKLKEQLSSE